MKKILNILVVSVLIVAVGSTIVSCEDETLGLGSGIVGGDSEGNTSSYDVIAYNTYSDSIRSDQNVLQNALLGVYSDNIFGTTNASLITQVRPSVTSPNFGQNAKVDSVSLFIPTYVVSGRDSVKTDTINLSKPGIKPEDADTILIKKIYKVDSIYGNRNVSMNLKVRDINTVLYANQIYYSKPASGIADNIEVNPTIIGSGTVGSTLTNRTIKVKSESTNLYEEVVGYKIPLDVNYFQNKIINNQNTGLLGDYATFIREVIKGLAISVEDQNGFLVAVNPGNLSLKMYYSSDNATDATKRVNSTLDFNLSSFWSSIQGPNVQVSHLKQSGQSQQFMDNLNPVFQTTGSPRLYLNGAAGTNVIVKFPEEQIAKLKADKETNNWTIVGAKLKFYIDETYNFPKPGFISAWNRYKDEGETVNKAYSDLTNYYNSYPSIVHFNPFIGKNDYYTLDITLHIKDMIEKGIVFLDQEMVVSLGNFLTSANDASVIYSTDPVYRNTVSNPYRVVLHGNATENLDKKLKLLVYYTKNNL